MTHLIEAALWSGTATLAALIVSRFWQRDDGTLWHGIWTAIAMASVMLPLARTIIPAVTIGAVQEGPLSQAAASISSLAATTPWLARLYLAGLAWWLFRLAGGWLLVRRIHRGSEAIDGIRLQQLRRCVSVEPGLVRVHSRVQVPLTLGVVRPVVLLPANWTSWQTDRLTAVLRHELAHVARHDYGWNLCALAFQAMFWFSPFAWIAACRIKLSAELAADRVASHGMDRVSYARILVESARDLVAERRPGLIAPGASTALDARVAALTTRPEGGPASSRRTRVIAVGIVTACLGATAFVRVDLQRAEHQEDHQQRHFAIHRGAGQGGH